MDENQNSGELRHSGGCLCGAVRFELKGNPIAVSICHCVSCQKVSGSAFSINCIFPREALTYFSTPTTYVDIGDSGNPVYREFCGRCGSSLQSRATATADFAVMKAGAFDVPSAFTPTVEIYCKTALPWLNDSNARARFATLPTGA